MNKEFARFSKQAQSLLEAEGIPFQRLPGTHVTVEFPEGTIIEGPGSPWINLPSGSRMAHTGLINNQALHLPGERCMPDEMVK